MTLNCIAITMCSLMQTKDIMNEVKLDQRYCQYIVHPKGGKPYQCIKTPTGYGYCRQHSARVKEKIKKEADPETAERLRRDRIMAAKERNAREKAIHTLYGVRVHFSSDDYMVREMPAKELQDEFFIAGFGHKVRYINDRVWWFKTKREALEWKINRVIAMRDSYRASISKGNLSYDEMRRQANEMGTLNEALAKLQADLAQETHA